MKKLTAADLLTYLTQEESSGNKNGFLIIVDLITNYYASSTQAATAKAKKDQLLQKIKADGEAAIARLNTSYDQVQGITWYEHKDQPKYVDITCYLYPYIGSNKDETWLRVRVNYTDAKSNAGWIFFTKITFSVDGNNTQKTFSYNDVTRDNDTEVWEYVDFAPTAADIALLRDIASSKKTIIRFEGSKYYADHVVTDKEKAAILDVLAVYEYMTIK